MQDKNWNVGKVLVVIGAIVGGIITIMAAGLKLYSHYCLLDEPLNGDDDEDNKDETIGEENEKAEDSDTKDNE